MTRTLIASLDGEYRRYKAYAEGALAQVSEPQLSERGPGDGNSLATICWHVAGNLKSRFTDFLTTDGEKPWRTREEEFEPRQVTRAELRAKWEEGWSALLDTLAALDDGMLERTVTIRQQPLAVHEALHRSLSHVSYHVGQIVYLAHALRGGDWKYLSIPPGQTDAYNKAPTHEKPAAYVQHAQSKADAS